MDFEMLESSKRELQETVILIHEMCRPEKVQTVHAAVDIIGKNIIKFSQENDLTTSELLAIVYTLSNGMTVTANEHARLMED
jgi:hypothetical protein